MSSYQTDEEDR